MRQNFSQTSEDHYSLVSSLSAVCGAHPEEAVELIKMVTTSLSKALQNRHVLREQVREVLEEQCTGDKKRQLPSLQEILGM